MTRTTPNRFVKWGLVGISWIAAAGCAAPQTTSPSGEPQNTDAGSAAVALTAAAIAEAKRPPKVEPTPVPSIDPQFLESASPLPAPKVVPTRKAKRLKKVTTEDSEPKGLGADLLLGTVGESDEVVVKCVVRLPDDDVEHPELCRNFRVVLLDSHDNEVARFRFDGDGMYRFKAEFGKTYRLKPLIASNWKFSIEPHADLHGGDLAKAVFVQKQ